MTTFYRRRKSAGLSWFGKLTKRAWIWWVWTLEPAIRHPIATIRDLFRKPDVTDDDLAHLTPEERKALK